MPASEPTPIWIPSPALNLLGVVGMWIGAVILVKDNHALALEHLRGGVLTSSSELAVALGIALLPASLGFALYWPERTYLTSEGLLSVRGVVGAWRSMLPKKDMERVDCLSLRSRRGVVQYDSWVVRLHRRGRTAKWLRRFGTYAEARALAETCAEAWDLPDPGH